MKILHIASNTNGYEEVTLLANAVSRRNNFVAIKKDGQEFWSGGFIINDTPKIRAILDSIPKEEQYDFVREFKTKPFVKLYLNEDEN